MRWSMQFARISLSVVVKYTGTLDALSEAMRVSWSCIASLEKRSSTVFL